MLGATWLILKTEGETLERARRLAMPLGAGLVALIGAVSLATPFLRPEYLERWFGWPSGAWSAIVPILLALAIWQLWTGLRNQDHLRPFLATVAIFVLSYAGLGVSFYPNLVPPALTIAEAAAPDSSLLFLLVGAVALIPMILDLHRLFLLGVPRQGPPRRRIPLMWRWLWFAGLYLAGIAAVGTVAFLIRLVLI